MKQTVVDDGNEAAYFSNMQDLLKIYETSKRFIFLSEYYNKNHKISISVINELRNALDHIMRAVKAHDPKDQEFYKAEGHLYRAAFDACEVIVINRLNYIYSFKADYGIDNLQAAFPKYSTEYLPSISLIIEDLSKLRSEEISSARLAKYETVVSKLIEICDSLDTNLIGIIERKDQSKRITVFVKKYFPIVLGFFAFATSVLSVALKGETTILLLSAFLLLILSSVSYYIFKFKKSKK